MANDKSKARKTSGTFIPIPKKEVKPKQKPAKKTTKKRK